MPATVMAADSKFLKPSIGLVLDLIPRWSCSIRLFRYFEDRNFVRQAAGRPLASHGLRDATQHSHRG
jgi:hypothetical protein